MATIEYDEDGLPCLVLDLPVPISPASAHDSLALDAAIERMCSVPPHSPEWQAARDEIQAIRQRGITAQG